VRAAARADARGPERPADGQHDVPLQGWER